MLIFVFTCMIGSSLFYLLPVNDAMSVMGTQPLNGVCIVVDAGHGGKDDGASNSKVVEDEINLSIAIKLKNLLENAGAEVLMTRDGDYDLAQEGAASRKKSDMKKRVELMNQEKVDLFVSIHLNSYPNTSVKGGQTFYQKENKAQEMFAKHMQEYLKKATHSKMTSKTGDYYILNETKKTGTLIECGFLSNYEECRMLQEETYQQEIAQELFYGISDYFINIQ